MPLETTEFFSDIHRENLVELLEVNLKSEGTPRPPPLLEILALSLMYNEPSAIC